MFKYTGVATIGAAAGSATTVIADTSTIGSLPVAGAAVLGAIMGLVGYEMYRLFTGGN